MMTAFMLWMSGSGVHPFSIMMTGYAGAPPLSPPPPPPPPLLCLAHPLLTCRRRAVAVYNPINSALNVNKQFKPFADPKADATMRGALLMAKVRAWRAWGLWEGGRGAGAAGVPPLGRRPLPALPTPQATFVVLNLLAMSGALYKMNTMGLLPNTPSDWASFLVVPPPVQVSTGSQISAPLAH